MRDTDPPDVRGLEAEAYDQHGYFTTRQALNHGITHQLLHHFRKAGRFQSVRRGLYRLHGFPTSEHDDIREKWMAVGTDKAIVSHESALALLDLSDNIPNGIHLLVSRRHRGLRPPRGVVLHTHLDSEPVPKVSRLGIAVTAPARTLIDSADGLQPDQFVRALKQALDRGLVTRQQLVAEGVRRQKQTTIEHLLGTLKS